MLAAFMHSSDDCGGFVMLTQAFKHGFGAVFGNGYQQAASGLRVKQHAAQILVYRLMNFYVFADVFAVGFIAAGQ
jgi:hypothetical protein